MRQQANLTPKFSQTIKQEDLDKIDRDLRFSSAATSNPQVLSSEQINSFNKFGFLKGIKIFESPEVAEHRKYFDELLAVVLASGNDSYSISTAHLSCGKVYDLLTNPRIVSYVRDLLGGNVIGWGSHYFCKIPQDGKTVSWHQDAAYWPLTPSKTVTVWLAIDDTDAENACVQFLPSSHLFGCLPHASAETLGAEVLDRILERRKDFGEPVDVVLKAGEISIHSDLLIHGSGANNSNRRRCGLTLRYCTPDVKACFGWHEKGVVVSGHDPTGHWANPSRPKED